MIAALGLSSWSAPATADQVDVCAGAAERAQSLKLAGKLRASRVELAKCVQTSCPSLIQKDCKLWEKDVAKDIASIVVRVEDPSGQPAADATLELDGEPVVAAGGVLEIDPGEHVLRADRPPFGAGRERVVMAPGERKREVVVRLAAAPAEPTPAEKPKSTGVPTPAWVVGGVGLAALGIGAGLWLAGLGQRDELRATCGVLCTPAQIDSVKWTLGAGDIVFSAGASALGTAVLLGIFLKESPSPPKGGAVAVAPLLGPSAAGLSLLGRF